MPDTPPLDPRVRLGHVAEATALIAELRGRVPHLSLDRWRIFSLYRNAADREHMVEALHEAGLR